MEIPVTVLFLVNTIHSWPQVIGMWSWLIDKVTFGMASNDPALLEQMEQGERMKFLLKQVKIKLLRGE